MKTLSKSILALALATTASASFAANMCKDFEVALTNETNDAFVITDANLTDGGYSTPGLGNLASNESKVLSVAKASDDGDMKGTFRLHTFSIPTKDVKIDFTLKNTGVHCHVKDISSTGDFTVADTRTGGRETFTIHAK